MNNVIASFNKFVREQNLEALPKAIDNYLSSMSHNDLYWMVYDEMLTSMSHESYDEEDLAEFVSEYSFED